MDILSPKPSGMELDDDGRANDKSVQPYYGQSKVGNLFLARHFAQAVWESEDRVAEALGRPSAETDGKHLPELLTRLLSLTC